jgi:hypothetical protein
MSRYRCTPDAPWSPEKGSMAAHPDALPDGDGMCHEGCCDAYRCPNCGTRYLVEQAE